VNGCGIARDAAGRGLAVLLVEQGDLAGATSSASTKLVHGGLRYLEQYEFRLVREALAEREILLRAAPHIISPLRFVLPHHAGLRPAWMIRLGLFLYDHLGGRDILPASRTLDLRRAPAGQPLQARYRRGFEYSDCWVDDARLVVLSARDAADKGASIRPRTRCTAARRVEGVWQLTLRAADGGEATEAARILVNAAGPWVSDILANVVRHNAPTKTRLVKGSHIVVRRLFDHPGCYIFQNADRRICFAIPYEDDFTLIGTTDEDFHSDPAHVACSPAEEAYLLAAVNEYFRVPVTPDQVVWRYAGVRPLHDDGAAAAQETTRDYVLELDAPREHKTAGHGTGGHGTGGEAPMLSVFGGKITTFRHLAEAAMDRLAPHIPGLQGKWTAGAALPGGDFPWNGVAELRAGLAARYPFLAEAVLRRLVRTHGTRTGAMLGDARGPADLGRHFGAGFTEREVDWLRREEWATTSEDMVLRRTKRGLHMTAAEINSLREFLGT